MNVKFKRHFWGLLWNCLDAPEKKKKGKAVLRREVAEMLPRMAILILFLTDGSVAE